MENTTSTLWRGLEEQSIPQCAVQPSQARAEAWETRISLPGLLTTMLGRSIAVEMHGPVQSHYILWLWVKTSLAVYSLLPDASMRSRLVYKAFCHAPETHV